MKKPALAAAETLCHVRAEYILEKRWKGRKLSIYFSTMIEF